MLPFNPKLVAPRLQGIEHHFADAHVFGGYFYQLVKVETAHGKGSQVLIVHPVTGRKYTLPYHLHKFINIKIFKKMLEWGFTEEHIWDILD